MRYFLIFYKGAYQNVGRNYEMSLKGEDYYSSIEQTLEDEFL